jgi:excisionase family DNA binding protein
LLDDLLRQALQNPTGDAAALIQRALDELAAAQSSSTPALSDWLTFSELAAELGVAPSTLDRWRTKRKLPPSIKVGKHRLFHRESLRDWLRAKERPDSERPKFVGRWGHKPAPNSRRAAVCAIPGCGAAVAPHSGPGPQNRYCPGHLPITARRRALRHAKREGRA